jgi:sulfur carrier protein ThiS
MEKTEVRAFGKLMKIFIEKNWQWPLQVEISENMTAKDLALQLDIPVDEIEAVFVNGSAQLIDCTVKSGDRIAFVPPGTPGPYRLMLGLAQRQAKEVKLGRKASAD